MLTMELGHTAGAQQRTCLAAIVQGALLPLSTALPPPARNSVRHRPSPTTLPTRQTSLKY